MSKYTFAVEAAISMHVEVEADSLEQAVEKAQQAESLSLCWQCAKGEIGAWNTSGEIDAVPSDSPLVEAWEGNTAVELEKVKELWDRHG